MTRICALILTAFIWLLGAMPALAHGGGTPQLVNEPAGPYLVSIWTTPRPLRVGELHVTVSLSEPEPDARGGSRPGDPVLNRPLRLEVRDAAGAVVAEVPVSHEEADNKLFYEADFWVEAAGEHTFTLIIDDSAQATFSATVEEGRQANLGLIGGAAAVTLVTVWLAWQQRVHAAARRGGGSA